MKHLFLLLLLMMFITPFVSAEEMNVSAANGFTCKGPSGVAVDLGFTKVGIPLSQATVYYNWISIAILVLVGAMASSRTTRFIALLLPIMAGILILFGWLTASNTSNPAQLWGIVVVCALLAVAVYMKGSLHEKFGIAGPGSLMFNVVFFMIILQAVVGFVNVTQIWENNVASVGQNEFSNIDLHGQIDKINNTGGLLNDIQQLGTILLEMTVGVLLMFVTMGIALVSFSVTLGMIFPWIPASPYGIAFLTMMQVGIYILYYMAYMRFIYKPIGEGDF